MNASGLVQSNELHRPRMVHSSFRMKWKWKASQTDYSGRRDVLNVNFLTFNMMMAKTVLLAHMKHCEHSYLKHSCQMAIARFLDPAEIG